MQFSSSVLPAVLQSQGKQPSGRSARRSKNPTLQSAHLIPTTFVLQVHCPAIWSAMPSFCDVSGDNICMSVHLFIACAQFVCKC